ncbi:MAG: polysaccharide export protein, partial [Okeania sp. SIO3I5]|uniref:SLBB domain-containing protein n=1 Tax=Okeania sp. SIO3I5 TaxID=2607805 RepID=UPI0013B8EFD9
MVYIGLVRKIVDPALSLSLLGLALITWPSSSRAEFPSGQEKATDTLALTCPQLEEKYILGPGDRINVKFLELEELSALYLIPADASISMPMIGSVSVGGLTIQQFIKVISTEYLRFFKEVPLLSVSIVAPRPVNVLISGEIANPGAYTVPLNSGSGDPRPGIQNPSITEAIDLAGGATLTADLSQVKVSRGQTSRGRQEFQINLWQLITNGDGCQNITLRDGDSIFIPTANNSNLTQVRQLALSNLATDIAQPRSVLVVGEVKRPGSYVVQGGNTTIEIRLGGLPTVTRSLQLAGGVELSADIRQIQLKRLTSIGTEQIINIDLWKLLQEGDINQDTIVQDGDTLIVPKTTNITPGEVSEVAKANFVPATIQVSVVGEVVRPGLIEIPSGATLNQALNAAGGENPRAKGG